MLLELEIVEAREYLHGSACRDHIDCSTAQEWYDRMRSTRDMELLSIAEIRAIVALVWGHDQSQSLRT